MLQVTDVHSCSHSKMGQQYKMFVFTPERYN